MRSNYKRIGQYIRQVKARNKDLTLSEPKGIKITKEFMPSVANTIGTDLSKYKVVAYEQFAYNPMHVGRDEVLPISMLENDESVIVSPAYTVFEIIDKDELLPEYLMMWCRRPEFDRNAWFTTDSSVRGGFSWESFCDMALPVPSIEKQREIVREYNVIVDRIKLNEQLNQKLEETAQAIYKHWFVDFEFPISAEYATSIDKPELEGKPYKSNGGEMIYCEELDQDIPLGWRLGKIIDQAHIEMGQSPKGDTYNYNGNGIPLVNGPVEFGEYFTVKTKWTTAPTKLSIANDLIVCVRGSTTGRFVKSDGQYCLGRGVCSIRAKQSQRYIDQLYKNLYKKMLVLTTGSTFPNWSRETIEDFPIISPSRNAIERYDGVVLNLVSKQEISCLGLIRLQGLKNILLSKMATIEDIREAAA